MASSPIPLAECPARLGWTLEHETIYADPPWLTVRLVPWFPECHPALAEYWQSENGFLRLIFKWEEYEADRSGGTIYSCCVSPKGRPATKPARR